MELFPVIPFCVYFPVCILRTYVCIHTKTNNTKIGTLLEPAESGNLSVSSGSLKKSSHYTVSDNTGGFSIWPIKLGTGFYLIVSLVDVVSRDCVSEATGLFKK
jgi:hypothetical protein